MQYNHGTPISDPLFYNSFLTSLLHTEQVVSTQATINFRWTTASKDTEMEKQCWMSRDKHDGVALGQILRSTLLNKPPARQPCFGGILHLDHLPATARKPSKIPKQGMIDKAEIRKPISEVLPIGIAGPLTLSLWLFSSFRYVWALTELCSSPWRWVEVIRLHRYVGSWESAGKASRVWMVGRYQGSWPEECIPKHTHTWLKADCQNEIQALPENVLSLI